MRTLATLILLVVLALSMACAPQRTIPKGMPYPKHLRRGMRVYPMNQLRCLGGGIGGCSLSGRPQQ